jgi:hypothetical protein
MANNGLKSQRQLLIDSRMVRFSINESKSSNGRLVVEGEFASYANATQNKRFYPESVWKKEIQRLEARLKKNRVFGELDHPEDGKTKLQRVSHLVTGLRLKDGRVIGEAVILNTRLGQDLAEIIRAGAEVGVSSRGFGSTVPNKEGVEVVQEDYELMTFDFVADPADANAYPTPKFEGLEFDGLELQEGEEPSVEDVRLEERARVTAELQKRFSEQLLAETKKLRVEVAEQVKRELAEGAAPEGAALVLAEIKKLVAPAALDEEAKLLLAGKNAEINRLTEEVSRLKGFILERDAHVQEVEARYKDLEVELEKTERVALVAGFRFFLEQQLMGDPDGQLVRKLVGDIEQYGDVQALQAKIEEIRSGLEDKRRQERERQEAYQRELDKIRAQYETELDKLRVAREEERKRSSQEIATVEENLAALAEKLEESFRLHKETLEENKQLQLKVYAEDQLAHNPRAPQVRQILENARPGTRQAIDRIVEATREKAPRDEEEAGKFRSRVKKLLGSPGAVPAPIDEERERPSPRDRERTTDWNGTGFSIESMKALAGIGSEKP